MMSALDRVVVVAVLGAVLLQPRSAVAQPIGSSTGEVRNEEPTDVSFRFGPVLVASGLTVQRLGIDNNVFDAAENPKRDWHAVITPDVTAYLRSGLVRFTLVSTADFTYYRSYASERGVNRSLRGRADLLLTRFRPFVGGALIDTRERANAEIDLRADRDEREVLGGFSLELSPITYVFAGVTRSEFTVDEGERYRGVNLAEQLDRRSAAVSIGVRRNLTPLTSVQVVGRVARDRFTRNATRDSAAKHLETIWRFAPDALWHGELSAGFQSFAPNDPDIKRFRGLTLGGRIEWPVLPATRLDVEIDRRVRYSYEEAEAYFVETATALTVTQRVIGSFDVRVRGSYRRLAYGNGSAPVDVDPIDRVTSGLAGVGYTFSDDSRVGFNYEFTNRESERRRDRLFDRHRLFASWAYKF